jgi:hypothetical protein
LVFVKNGFACPTWHRCNGSLGVSWKNFLIDSDHRQRFLYLDDSRLTTLANNVSALLQQLLHAGRQKLVLTARVTKFHQTRENLPFARDFPTQLPTIVTTT